MFMFQFFVPITKVQKDRLVMRETDARVAKYSRRGIVFNFIAYLICFIGGTFVQEFPTYTLVLTVGLLCVTLLRGFFLFRFEQLYPRAPAKWRNQYFAATLLGSMWWAAIMVSVTYKLQMNHEAPLFWLYTVVFFSTTAHAFAPYQKFLTYYQFFGLVPAALAALSLGSVNGVIYGALLLVFYLVLNHQCRMISETYWERLEATYALARKTRSVEEEKRDTRASVKLNKEFLNFLRDDLQKIVTLDQTAAENAGHSGDITLNKQRRNITLSLERIFDNVDNFTGTLTKELTLSQNVFNIRHELQHIIAEYVDECEGKGIQIESALSPNLPMRLKGDASKLAQVLKSLLNLCIKDMPSGLVLVEVEFLREYETAGELYITISRLLEVQKKLFFLEDSNNAAKLDLSFSSARAIAEYMEGGIETSDIPGEGQRFRFSAKLEIAEALGQLDFHKNYFSGHSVLLVHGNARIVDLKRQELDSLGFNVITETQYKRAYQTLENSYKNGKPIESVLYYVEHDSEDFVEFNNNINAHSDLKNTHQLVVSTQQQHALLAGMGFVDHDNVCYVNKPAGLFELESSFQVAYKNKGEDGEIIPKKQALQRFTILAYSKNTKADAELRNRLQGKNCDLVLVTTIETLEEQFSQLKPSVVLIDCDDSTDVSLLVDRIREKEIKDEVETFTPIVGMSTSKTSFESSVYEIGFDDYINLSDRRRSLRATIKYWITLKLTD